jgi:hypothetical protein
MSSIPVLLAYEVGLEDVMASWHSINPSTLNGLLVVGAIGLVTLLVLVWAIFFRKRGRRRRRSHRHAHHQASTPFESPPDSPEGEAIPSSQHEHRTWRRSRRRRHSRNPTLAETGGLPPVRPDEPPEPQT